MKQKHHEGQHMKTGQGFRPALVIASQTTKARHPGERALHHPSAGQQDEASLGLGQANHFQAHAMGLGNLGRVLASVTLIDKGEFDVLSRHFLHGSGQLPHLIPVLFVSGRDMQGQQMSQRIHRQPEPLCWRFHSPATPARAVPFTSCLLHVRFWCVRHLPAVGTPRASLSQLHERVRQVVGAVALLAGGE
jgi:hypothetical protein